MKVVVIHPTFWKRSRTAVWLRSFSLVLATTLLVACGAVSSPTAAPAPSSPGGADLVPASAPPATAAATPAVPPVAATDAAPVLPATVSGLEGETVTIESVERIVSLNGDMTEIIFALGLGAQIVGVDSSATYPPDATQELPNIGYQRRLSAEGILALNPTLVIGDEAAGPPEALDQIRSAGVPVALTPDPPTLEAPGQKIRFVAQALGVAEQGERLAAQVEAEIAAARAAAERQVGTPQVIFLYLRGTDVQQVAGAGTAADAMITAAGGANAASDAGIVEFKPLSPETLIAAQPDVLLVMDKGLESVGGVDGLLRIPGLADTPAGQHRRVVALDDLYLLGMGPRTGQALADLVAAFHDPATQGAQP
jgi:iron complex transport system substrate-binding protein